MKRIPESLDLPRPYLVFNRSYARVHPAWKSWRTRLKEEWRHLIGIDRWMPSPNLPEKVSVEGIKKGKFWKDALIIDRECRRYPVTGFETLGRYRDFWNLWGWVGRKEFYYRLLVGEPIQLTFEEALSEIVEHCVERRWCSQANASSRKEFREHYYSKTDIESVMDNIGFLGSYPF